MVNLTIFWVLDLGEVSLCQTLVTRLLLLPVIVEVIVSNLCMVLSVSLAVLTILEWECP